MIKIMYNPKQVPVQDFNLNFSKSPLKPKLLLEYLKKMGLDQHFEIIEDFKPFDNKDFYIAHTKDYVDGFFSGDPNQRSKNGLAWSQEFAESVRYTNASLYNAILHSIHNPEQTCFSPTSGFHHARPNGGSGFCTFSGQVIASVKLFRKYGLRGAYIDLDGHYGNSIEDSRNFVEDLNEAIPEGFNINPRSYGNDYVNNLKENLIRLRDAILNNKIDYLVWCHGADSHEWDDLHGQCSTEEWMRCSSIFYNFVKETEYQKGSKIPLTLSLFGGYRADDYNSVLSLHTADLVMCMNVLQEKAICFSPRIKNPREEVPVIPPVKGGIKKTICELLHIA